jgi:hypothetical protein
VKTISFLIFSILCLSLSCKKDEKTPSTENSIIIGNDAFSTYPNDHVIISAVSISGDNLQIGFGSSGCDGKRWIIELVGSSDILYSDPPQRQIRLSLKNNEDCQAAFGKTMTFNLKPSRINSGEIILNLAGWNSPIRYKY